VGETDPRTGQLIVAILRSDDYLICTPYYGVHRGEPLRVAAADVSNVQYFEGLDNARENLRLAVDVIDHGQGSLQSRLRAAALILAPVSLDDFPAIMTGDFLSLQHMLTWRGSLDDTISQMSDAEAHEAVASMRGLYVDVLGSIPRPEEST
jgi:hypothetical protein